jgi:hypothetical protein
MAGLHERGQNMVPIRWRSPLQHHFEEAASVGGVGISKLEVGGVFLWRVDGGYFLAESR